MQLMPTVAKFLFLTLLSAVWLAIHNRAGQVDANLAYHVGAYRRDRRKARFYFLSVWVGLGAAFISFGGVEAFSGITFDSPVVRDWVMGFFRGLGLWGLLITGATWAMVGQRVSQTNSDGMSLTPLAEEERNGDKRAR